MSEAIENITFKMCMLSSMFVEYHALPLKAGKTEIKLLQMAYTLRTGSFFEVFQTFIQHMWLEPEKFFVTRLEFVSKMSEYPLSHFMKPETFRKMISIRMPSTAAQL